MVYRFADCELDEQLYQLRRNSAPVALEPKVFDVLAYLIHHRDRVVSKDELLDKLWPGQVVGENALTRCIRAARAAVGDDGTRQEIIETQHGRGYRFVAAVVAPLVSSSKFQVLSQEESASRQEEESQKAKGENPATEQFPLTDMRLLSQDSTLSTEDLGPRIQDFEFPPPNPQPPISRLSKSLLLATAVL